MYPYINIGSFHIGTFGLMLWLAAVVATVVLHKNFDRYRVDADALNVVALVVIAGVIGAKVWHELQDVPELRAALRQIVKPGLGHPLDVAMEFLHWFQAGFAWYGGLTAGIVMLMLQGQAARFKGPGWKPEGNTEATLGMRVGALRLLDLAAPAAAIGYGVGRIGCLTSGDGDYGKNTTSHFWGVHMAKNALVPPTPPDTLVLPTPLWELAFALALAWMLWRLGRKTLPVGWMTGVYLVASGCARFVVEFWRINPPLYFHKTLSNAQVAAMLSVLAGALIIGAANAKKVQWVPELTVDSRV